MNNRRPTGRGRPDRSHGAKPYNKAPRRPATPPSSEAQRHLIESAESRISFIERWPDVPGELPRSLQPVNRSGTDPFRMLIAVHRPRYRGRTERAAAITGWNVVSLLNKQDAVGQVQKGNNPPDIVVLSSDFGRQKSFGIFKAIQSYRALGMKIIGLVETCDPDELGNNPTELCDICLPPPYKTADLQALFRDLYKQIRGMDAPVGEPAQDGVDVEGDDD